MSEETSDVNGVSGERIKSYLDRVERLEEDKRGISEDVKDIWAEAKGFGFDVKTLKQMVKLRQIDDEKRREADELLELYKASIGME